VGIGLEMLRERGQRGLGVLGDIARKLVAGHDGQTRPWGSVKRVEAFSKRKGPNPTAEDAVGVMSWSGRLTGSCVFSVLAAECKVARKTLAAGRLPPARKRRLLQFSECGKRGTNEGRRCNKPVGRERREEGLVTGVDF
jgi:hypothetical protein